MDSDRVLDFGGPDAITLDGHSRRVKHVQVQIALALLAQAVVRLAGVLASVLKCHLRQHMVEARRDEAVVLEPTHATNGRFRVYVTPERGHAVDLDPEGILGADVHSREVVDVEGDASREGLAGFHRAIAYHALENRAVVLLARYQHVVLARVHDAGRITAVPPDLGFGAASGGVAGQLHPLVLFRYGSGGDNGRRARCTQHR